MKVRKRTLTIIDWEIGMLYLRCMNSHNNNEEMAIKDVRYRFLMILLKLKIYYFFLRTTKEWHTRKARNPFLIIGVFAPPFPEETQIKIEF